MEQLSGSEANTPSACFVLYGTGWLITVFKTVQRWT
jgi:hypothetical protein